MTIRSEPRCSLKRPWPMSNLKRSTHFWTAMAGLVDCSSRTEGVLETAQDSVDTAQRLVRISVEDTARIQTLGRLAGSCLQVHQALRRRMV
jgi:hypothetical protein